jgi:polar amino acid transport system substrate-binding protein
MLRDDPRIADLVRAGAIRTGLFLPQFIHDRTSGELRGLGTGYIAIEMTRMIAEHLGVAMSIVEYPSPKAAVAGLKNEGCDVVFLGVEPTRATEVDFAPAIFQFDYSLLVPQGSAIQSIADADQPGIRIGLIESHASALALQRMIKHAQLIGVELPEQAPDLIRQGKVDALAFPRDHLLDFADQLPGSHVLAKGYGINRVAMAIRQNRAGLLAFASEFSEQAKQSGLVQSAIERGSLRGFAVAD